MKSPLSIYLSVTLRIGLRQQVKYVFLGTFLLDVIENIWHCLI